MNNRDFQYENSLLINMMKSNMSRDSIINLTKYLSNNEDSVLTKESNEEMPIVEDFNIGTYFRVNKNINQDDNQCENNIYKLSDEEIIKGSKRIFLKYNDKIYIKPSKLYISNSHFYHDKLTDKSVIFKYFFSARNKSDNKESKFCRLGLTYYIDKDGSIVLFEQQYMPFKTSVSITEIHESRYRNLKLEFYINKETDTLEYLKLVPVKDINPILSFRYVVEKNYYNSELDAYTNYTSLSFLKMLKNLFENADKDDINCIAIDQNNDSHMYFTNKDLILSNNRYKIAGLIKANKSHGMVSYYLKLDSELQKKYKLGWKRFLMNRSSELKNSFYIKLNEGVEYIND